METEQLTTRIARRIAAHEGVSAAALDPPLYEVVNIDALGKLIRSRSHERTKFNGFISFDYRDYAVTVDYTGTVSVTPSTAEDNQPELADRDGSTDGPVTTQ